MIFEAVHAANVNSLAPNDFLKYVERNRQGEEVGSMVGKVTHVVNGLIEIDWDFGSNRGIKNPDQISGYVTDQDFGSAEDEAQKDDGYFVRRNEKTGDNVVYVNFKKEK